MKIKKIFEIILSLIFFALLIYFLIISLITDFGTQNHIMAIVNIVFLLIGFYAGYFIGKKED